MLATKCVPRPCSVPVTAVAVGTALFAIAQEMRARLLQSAVKSRSAGEKP